MHRNGATMKRKSQEKTINRLMTSAILMLALTLPTAVCLAKSVSISGTHGRNEIQGKCLKQGGFYYANGKGKGATYGCLNGKKDTSIVCNSQGKCTGEVPG